ncbi:MAG: flagellar basal-body rod protein FlgF [Sandaracinaceae bacterium]
MSDGIYSALSGAVAQQRSLDVVANNVANVGTVGYRADTLAFREALSQQQGQLPDGLRYVTVEEVSTDSSAGPLTQTGNRLDVALNGDGMLAVSTPDGTRYTRAGSLRMDAQGVLRTPSGHGVLDANANQRGALVTIPPNATEIAIATDGTVTADGADVGRLRVDRFADGALQKEGLTLFRATGNGTPAAETEVLQGYVEGANVSPVSGMNELIGASRAFDAFQRVIQAFKQIDEHAARELGKNG